MSKVQRTTADVVLTLRVSLPLAYDEGGNSLSDLIESASRQAKNRISDIIRKSDSTQIVGEPEVTPIVRNPNKNGGST